MVTSPELQSRIDAFAASLQEEFGEIPQGEHDCLLSAIEDFGVQIGDAVARSVSEIKASDQLKGAAEECCPVCCSPGEFKGERKRLLDGRRGKLKIKEPEYFCSKCRKSFFPSDASNRSRS